MNVYKISKFHIPITIYKPNKVIKKNIINESKIKNTNFFER